MENEKLTYINSRGERLELGVDSVYHCNISKDVEGMQRREKPQEREYLPLWK